MELLLFWKILFIIIFIFRLLAPLPHSASDLITWTYKCDDDNNVNVNQIQIKNSYSFWCIQTKQMKNIFAQPFHFQAFKRTNKIRQHNYSTNIFFSTYCFSWNFYNGSRNGFRKMISSTSTQIENWKSSVQ